MLGQSLGEGWLQIYDLAVAFVLCSAIGLERELRQKSAGLRTHTLVGLGAALFMLISKYGFTDVVGPNVLLDPSRVAAQIVSGIGFIGAGLIFVRRDAVRGLTTAAVIWVTAAVGAACGANLPILAIAVTIGHFIIVFIYPPLLRRLPGARWSYEPIDVQYVDGRGILRHILLATTSRGFMVADVNIYDRDEAHQEVSVTLHVRGRGQATGLAAAIGELEGVTSVRTRSTDPEA